jgi:6-pyruvoyl-tetrahydropterin synthase
LTIISENELENKLNQFRDVLINYDYSEIDNVIFFDINSLNHYIENYKENPFEKQYDAIENILNSIYPYLPGSLPSDTINLISKIINVKSQDEELIKQNVLFNIKLDFIEMVKDISTEKEWNDLVELCKKIRYSKTLI